MCSTESAKKKVQVELLKFVLFLYIQNAPRVSLKSSIVNDQYPLQCVCVCVRVCVRACVCVQIA